MKAVIMAGGFGTRLRPVTDGIPKPCVPVVGVPCIVRIVRQLAELGIREFHVSLFYLPEQIKAALSLPEFRNLSLVFHQETVPLGTAGSVRNCLSGNEDEFIVVSGDSVFDFDLGAAIAAHHAYGGPVTLISSRVSDPGEFGVMLCDAGGRVLRFLEKPDWEHAYSDEVNTGIYLCSASFMENIPEGRADFSKDVFPRMLEQGVPIFRYFASGYWCDVGTVAAYLDCNRRRLGAGEGETLSATDPGTVIEQPCYIGNNVRMKNCHIGPYTVVGDGCDLDGVRLEGCVLHSGVVCKPGAVARNAVLCKNSRLATQVRVGDGCVVGAESEIGPRTILPAGVKIFSSNRIPGDLRVFGNVHHKLPNPVPEDGKLLFPFGEDFGGARIYEIGRTLAELFDGDLVVGRGEQKDASSAMTFCGGVLACGRNVYDTGVNDLSRFRFTVRNYAFKGGAYFDRNYSNLVLRLYDGNGMPLSSQDAKKFFRILSRECSCGESDGMYRIFRGGTRSYHSFLKSFGPVSRLYLRVVSSPALASLLPGIPEPEASERMRVGSEWIRIEGPDGEPFSEDLIRLCVCISLGRLRSPVYIPDDFPRITEQIASDFGFRVVRVSDDPDRVRKLFPLTDPNVQALLILRLLERERSTFGEFVRSLPGFVLKQRDVPVSTSRGAVMRTLSSWGGELQRGVRFSDRGGSVRIVPKSSANAFRIIAEASTAELAEELCEFYSAKLKGLKPD